MCSIGVPPISSKDDCANFRCLWVPPFAPGGRPVNGCACLPPHFFAQGFPQRRKRHLSVMRPFIWRAMTQRRIVFACPLHVRDRPIVGIGEAEGASANYVPLASVMTR